MTIEKEQRRLLAVLDRKRQAGVVLDAKLLSLEIVATESIGPERASVRTKERWRYRDRPVRPGVEAGRELLADMELQYYLLRHDGRWKVVGTWVPTTQYYDPLTERPIELPEFAHGAPDGPPPGPGAHGGGHAPMPGATGPAAGMAAEPW